MRSVHLVGSVGLDTTEEVFAVAGRLLGRGHDRAVRGTASGELPRPGIR